MNTVAPLEGGYWLRYGEIRWCSNGGIGSPVKKADLATFQQLNHIWAKDKHRVYCLSKPLRGADLDTFEVLNHLYAKDKNRAYYLSGAIKEVANPATFRTLDTGEVANEFGNLSYKGYCTDGTLVFHYVMTIGKPSILKGADVGSFEVLKFGYARDKDRVYYERNRMKGANPKTFKQFNEYFSADDKSVFYLYEKMDADLKTFQVLSGLAAKDAHHVYLRTQIIEKADPATYQMIRSDSIGKDKNHVFSHGEIVPDVDVTSFEHVDGSYYKDNKGILYSGFGFSGFQRLPEADPNTFEVINGPYEAQDEHFYYANGVRERARKI